MSLYLVLGSCSLILRSSLRNVSCNRRYTSLGFVLGSCILRSSRRNVSHARRYMSLDLVLDAEVLGPQ